MNISENTFRNGTEVDLTNDYHNKPNLTLTLNNSGKYIIRNYKTNAVHLELPTLGHAIAYCNTNFDTNFKTI
jgi:hypothetical protein